MPRPPFSPDERQRPVLDGLARLAARRAKLDEQIDALIDEANGLEVPISVIAEKADMERKTVYRKLGRSMR